MLANLKLVRDYVIKSFKFKHEGVPSAINGLGHNKSQSVLFNFLVISEASEIDPCCWCCWQGWLPSL